MGSPAAALLASYGYAVANGYPDIHQMGYLASGLCCIGELEGLSAQPTARLGNALGIIGVTTGIASTFGLLSPSSEDGPGSNALLVLMVSLVPLLPRSSKLQICPSLLLLFTP